jgi:hypothetical protein
VAVKTRKKSKKKKKKKKGINSLCEGDDEDYALSMDIPVLPPKPEKILNQMKEVVQQQRSSLAEGSVAVGINANALVSTSDPPAYAEFDDE